MCSATDGFIFYQDLYFDDTIPSKTVTKYEAQLSDCIEAKGRNLGEHIPFKVSFDKKSFPEEGYRIDSLRIAGILTFEFRIHTSA